MNPASAVLHRANGTDLCMDLWRIHVLTLATSSATLSCIHALQCMRRKARALQEVACTSEPKSCLDPCQGLRISTKKSYGDTRRVLKEAAFFQLFPKQIANVTPSYGDWLFHLIMMRVAGIAVSHQPKSKHPERFCFDKADCSQDSLQHSEAYTTYIKEVGPRYLPGSHMAVDVTKSNQKTCPDANSKT